MRESLEEAVDNLSRCGFGTALQVIAGTEMMQLIVQETSTDRIIFHEDTKRWPTFRPLGSVAKTVQYGMPTNAIPPVAFDFTKEANKAKREAELKHGREQVRAQLRERGL